MILAIVVHEKHGLSAQILALKEAQIKKYAIPVHMHHKQTTIKQLKDKVEITAGEVHEVYINKTKTLPLPIEEEWSKATP